MHKHKLIFAVFLLSTFYFLLSFPRVSFAALLYSGAANEVVYQNRTFVVEWYLDTQGQAVNSVDLKLHFTTDTLELTEANAGDSALDLWVKAPEFDNQKGTIDLIGGLAGGVNTSKLPIFRTTFRGKAVGPAQIFVDDSSEVLLANGAGTPLKLSFSRLAFPVVEGTSTGVAVSSDTQPDENKWYKNNQVEIEVYPKSGDVYSYSFSSNLDINPDDKVDDISKKLVFTDLPDGIYYFKLASKTGNGNWQETLVRRFQIDATPPEPFTAKIASDPSIFDGQEFVSFTALDKESGIDHYEVRFGGIGPWTRTQQTSLQLPKIRVSDKVEVKAVDLAGNERLAQIVYIQPGNGWNFAKSLIFIIILVIAGLLIWLVWYVIKHTKFRNQRIK